MSIKDLALSAISLNLNKKTVKFYETVGLIQDGLKFTVKEDSDLDKYLNTLDMIQNTRVSNTKSMNPTTCDGERLSDYEIPQIFQLLVNASVLYSTSENSTALNVPLWKASVQPTTGKTLSALEFNQFQKLVDQFNESKMFEKATKFAVKNYSFDDVNSVVGDDDSLYTLRTNGALDSHITRLLDIRSPFDVKYLSLALPVTYEEAKIWLQIQMQ